MSRPVVSELRTQPAAASSSPHRPGSSAPSTASGGRQPAEDERAEAVRIADADHPALVEDHEAVRAADAGQDPEQRLDGVGRRLVGQERGQELRVGRRGQPGAAAAAAGRAARGC